MDIHGFVTTISRPFLRAFDRCGASNNDQQAKAVFAFEFCGV
jgi:hypothetical protein